MSLHLFASPTSNSSSLHLHVLVSHENGCVALRRNTCPQSRPSSSVDGIGWHTVWTTKLHVESGAFFEVLPRVFPFRSRWGSVVMAMAVTRDNTLALSVSADHLIGRYDLTVSPPLVPLPSFWALIKE
jgi:hypothetical protein